MDFPAFFARTCPAMLARALMLTDNRQDAEDAVQEAFAEAMRSWAELRERDAEEWVYQVVRRRLWAAARRWRRYRPLDLVVELPARSSPEQLAEVRQVLDALSQLPRKHRLVAYLHWVEGQSAAGVAAELNLSERAAKAMIGKSRELLDSFLGVTGVSEEGALAGRPRDVVGLALLRTEAQLRAGIDEAQAAQRIGARVGL